MLRSNIGWGLIFIFILSVAGCSNGDGGRDLPYGKYESTVYPLVEFSKDGTFTIQHLRNSHDSKDYTLSGTFIHTLEVDDPNNDTYGKLDLHVTGMTINSAPTTQIDGTFCDYSSSCSGPTVNINDTLVGWWAYSSNITWGGSMRISLNYPPELRGPDPYSGHRSLISVDPM